MNENKTHDGFYFCKGISSKIYENLEYGLVPCKRELHVIQLDLDDMEQNPAETKIFDTLPDGIYLILQTDDNSYNITSLTLYDFRQVCEAKASIQKDDSEHLKIGIDRGFWILRLSDKLERARPELIDFKDTRHQVKDSKMPMKLSKPHAELYEKLYSEFDLRSMLPAGNYVEGDINVEKYPTRVKQERE